MLNNLNVTIDKKINDFANHSINESSVTYTQSNYSNVTNLTDDVSNGN
jgi:hypothetical protein